MTRMHAASRVASFHPLPRLGAMAVLGLVLLLAGCGFAPRGALKLPEGFGAIAVSTADPYSPLAEGLRRDLRRAGAPVFDDADAEGVAMLAITAEAWSTRALSVDAFVATREVETRYAVTFDLIDATGRRRLEQQRIELARDYLYDAVEAFGNPGEQEIVQDELRRDMQAAILRRVDIALRTD